MAKKKAAKKVKKVVESSITQIQKQKTKKKAAKKKAVRKPEGTCFVMIPFVNPFNIYYQSIFKPAIIAANLEPVRADDLFRPSVIVADLWQMIQDSKVLLAELTTKNANVFYELGLAHAIGKPVILVSETMEDVPFDLQQLRVLLYDKDDPAWGEKLTKSITRALKETVASPIEAVPGIFRKKVESQAPEQDATIARIEALEKQMRSVRAPTIYLGGKFRRRTLGLIETNALRELEGTMDKGGLDLFEFDIWTRRWHEYGFGVPILEGIIMASTIPETEQAELVIKRMGKVISGL